jgi:hypothetical protein
MTSLQRLREIESITQRQTAGRKNSSAQNRVEDHLFSPFAKSLPAAMGMAA